MDSPRQQLREAGRADRRLRRVLPLTAAVLLLLLGGLGYVLYRDYRAGRQMAERVAYNASLGIERELVALLGEHDQAYSALVHDWSHRQAEASADALADLDHAVGEYAQRMPELLTLAVVDAGGNVVASSRGDLALEAPSRAGRGLAVGLPLRDAVSGHWVLPLSLAIREGPLRGGHVVGLLEVHVLQAIAASRDLGNEGGVALFHTDGFLLARSRDPLQPADMPVGDDPDFRQLVTGPRVQKMDLVSPFDGIERIGMHRRLADYPFIVAAGVSRREALASWYGFAAVTSVVTLMLITLGGVLLGSLLRANRRQRHVLEALRETAGELADAQAIAGLGRWRLDPEAGRVEASVEVYRILGRERAAMGDTLRAHTDMVHPDDAATVLAALERTIAGGEPMELEHRVQRPDGSVRHVRTVGERITEDGGRPIVVGTLQDVTAEAELRAQLQRTEAEYRLLFERNPMPMWVIDLQTLRFLRVNEAAIAHYGYTREQFLAMTALDIRPPEDIPDALRALRGDPDRLSGHVWRHLRADGSIIHVSAWSVRAQFEGRDCLIALILDITDRLRAEVERAESELRFSIVAEGTSDAIWDWNLQNDALWWSGGLYRICGIPPGELPTLADWESRVHPDDVARVVAGLNAAVEDPSTSSWEDSYRFRRADGSWGEFVDRGKVLRDAHGKAYRMIGGITDVTERRRDEASLRLLRRAIEAADNGVLIADAADAALPVVYVNPAFERISGLAGRELAGLSLRSAAAEGEGTLRVIAHGLMAGRDAEQLVQLQRADGSRTMVQLRVAPVRGGDGRVTHRVAVLMDVTEREQAQARLAYQESHDGLTGLPNRAALASRLDAAIRRCRGGRCEPEAVFVDLDHFALINDSLGHPVGDQVLRGVAQRLMDALPEADVVGRFGGDEFVAVFGEASPGQVGQAIERITATLSRPLEVLGTVHYLTCSVGRARWPDGGNDAESMLKNAELAMYQAKKRGRNCVVSFSGELTAQVNARLHVVSRLREALARDEFVLHYQPQYTADGRRVIGLEALVRWNHPERGLVPPGEFIGICEDSGLIVPLGRWVLREAARDHERLRGHGLDQPIAVNVSAEHFQHGSLVEDVIALTRQHGLPRGGLELELTEGVVLEQPEATIATIGQLRALGARVAIDDFGTGYSSLSYLRRLPVDKLKIDRSFVADLPDDAGAAAVCDTVIDLAHSFGHEVVAEGVEHPAQQQWLLQRGCDAVQGFLFARPMGFDDVVALLREPVA